MRSTTITDDGRRIRQRLIVAAIVIVVVNLLNVAFKAISQRQVVEGPAGSTNATVAEGAAAWRELLDAVGLPAGQLEQPIRPNLLSANTVLVILDAGFWQPAETEIFELRRFLDQGGRLVIGGWISDEVILDIGGTPPPGQFSGPTTSKVLTATDLTEGVTTIASPGQRSFIDSDDVAILGDDNSATVLMQPVGDGRIVFLADAAVVSNAYIGQADNAILAVNLAAGRTVIFNEYIHGFGSGGLFSVLPERWSWALWLLAGAVLVGMIATGRRLGPPEPEHRDLSPERRLYVDALASLMARSKHPEEATDIIRSKAKALIISRTGLPGTASIEQLRTSAEALGLDQDETDALLTKTTTGTDLIAADRALAKVQRGEL